MKVSNLRPTLSVCSGCHSKIPQTEGLMQRFIFSHSRSYKSKNKMSSELGPAESTFLLGPHVMEKEKEICYLCLFLYAH